MTVDLIICGASGRMGRTILGLAAQAPDLRVVGAIEAAGQAAVGVDAGEVAGCGALGVLVQSEYEAVVRPDAVTLDFTSAAAAVQHLRVAVAKQAPVVIGTTGFDDDQRAELDQLAGHTRTVIAPNMSVGVNVLLTLARQAARILGDGFDPEIVELHHRMKVDAPSGTALALARTVGEALGRDLREHGVFGRQGVIGARPDREIGVMALRGGDAVGDHTVLFVGMGERLELTHRAQSRECLARGALRAARWLAAQSKPGRYSMADVLGLDRRG